MCIVDMFLGTVYIGAAKLKNIECFIMYLFNQEKEEDAR